MFLRDIKQAEAINYKLKTIIAKAGIPGIIGSRSSQGIQPGDPWYNWIQIKSTTYS